MSNSNVPDISILKKDRISSSMQPALEHVNLIKRFEYFLYVKHQIDDDKVIKELELDKFEKDIVELMQNVEFRLQLELYYKILESEEGRVLLDPKDDSNPLYNIEPFYNILKVRFKYEVELPIILGKIMKNMGDDETANFNF